MKIALTTLLFIFGSAFANEIPEAEILEVTLDQSGLYDVTVSYTTYASGCNGATTYLDVLREPISGVYVAGRSDAIKNDEPYQPPKLDLGDFDPGRMTCMGFFPFTTKARFIARSQEADSVIKISVPFQFGRAGLGGRPAAWEIEAKLVEAKRPFELVNPEGEVFRLD